MLDLVAQNYFVATWICCVIYAARINVDKVLLHACYRYVTVIYRFPYAVKLLMLLLFFCV
jgi:hypothetical protein